MCRAAAAEAEIHVIIPTPWVPPLVPIPSLARFRRVPHHLTRDGVTAHFPRVPGSIEYHTHAIDARLALSTVLATARRLHAERPFDVIHAHFIYPDGVVASTVGRALRIPVMTSEHAFWTPWLSDRRSVGRQVDAALSGIRLVTAVSHFLLSDIIRTKGSAFETDVLSNVVDDETFSPSPRRRDPYELLFVGLIRRFKRIDVLLRALAIARRSMPALHLRVLSANAFQAYGKDRREMRALIGQLGLTDAVTIVDGADPPAVAEAMRRCAFVTVSSTRRETFCSVAAEALACGTPLVITRCGGPEEFVTAQDGVMVDADDPDLFAAAILQAMSSRDKFDPVGIRDRIVNRFGRHAWRERALSLYDRLATEGVP